MSMSRIHRNNSRGTFHQCVETGMGMLENSKRRRSTLTPCANSAATVFTAKTNSILTSARDMKTASSARSVVL